MTIEFYKDSLGTWHFNGETRPVNTLICVNINNTTVGFKTLNEVFIIDSIDVTNIVKENGIGYSNLSEFNIATADFFADATQAVATRITYLEQHAYDTLWIDYWQVGQPTSPTIGQTWFNNVDTIKAWNGSTWNTIPIDFYKLYVKASISPRETYTWSGSAMVAVSVPLTKPAVEALIYNGSIVPAALDINTASADVFVKTLTGATSFTISNPILYKPFRITLTGGSLNATLFTGYTTNWILTSLITDYVNTVSNVLWCEVRSAGQVYCFWGA